MATHSFRVEERPVPFSHFHGWVAVDESTGQTIPLPDGGNGEYLGCYPEIEGHLKTTANLSVDLSYASRLGDTLEIEQGIHATFTYQRGNDKIIIRDIPRKVWSVTVSRT